MTYNMHLMIAMEITRTLESQFVAQIFWAMQLLTLMNAIQPLLNGRIHVWKIQKFY